MKRSLGRYLHLRGFVVPPVLVFVGCAVAVAQESLEPILPLELAHYLVQGLTVEGVVVHGEGRVADAGQQGRVRVLAGVRGLKGAVSTWR